MHRADDVTAAKLDAHLDECRRRYEETTTSITRLHERVDRGQSWLLGIMGTALLTLLVTILQFALNRH